MLDVLVIAGSVGFAIFLVTFGFREFIEFMTLLLDWTWNALKSGILWLAVKENRRNALQRKYNTDMMWHDVRWSIARLEHELLPKDEWTHEVEDCVDPACNAEHVRKLKRDLPHIPVLPVPPPPPPPRRSRGGPVKASELSPPPLSMISHFKCPACKMISYNPNDVREQYCGNCHAFFKW